MRALLCLLCLSTACGWGQPAAEPAPELKVRCRPADAPATPAATPWTVGQPADAGWNVTAIDDGHSEFVRLQLQKGDETTGLEIAYVTGETSDWSTSHYRLMPAPGEEPPTDLLEATMVRLRALEQSHGGAPVAAEATADIYAGLPPCAPPDPTEP